MLALKAAGVRVSLIDRDEWLAAEFDAQGGVLFESPLFRFASRSADTISALRQRALARGSTIGVLPGVSLILFGISLDERLYTTRSKNRFGALPALKLALDVLTRQRGYSAQHTADELASEHFGESIEILRRIRMPEVRLLSLAAGTIAARHFCPVLRLPAGIDPHDKLILRFDMCIRSEPRTAEKRERKARAAFRLLRDALRGPLPQSIMNALNEPGHVHVKLVADAPLEWVAMPNGVPLQLAVPTSRVPASPGYLFAELARKARLLNFRCGHTFKVLILRSFGDADPVRPLLETAINRMLAERSDKSLLGTVSQMVGRTAGSGIRGPTMEIRIVDFGSVAEARAALRLHQPDVLIFDCHGRRSLVRPETELVLADGAAVDTGALISDRSIPPIVLFSCCDSHALRGRNESVACAMLAGGAEAVLASVFPVNAPASASFFTNLLYYGLRVLPLMVECTGVAMRWMTIVTWVQRVEHLHSVLSAFCARSGDGLSPKAWNSVISHLMRHGLSDRDWFSNGLAVYGSRIGADPNWLANVTTESGDTLSEAMRYIQLGFPENIILGAPW